MAQQVSDRWERTPGWLLGRRAGGRGHLCGAGRSPAPGEAKCTDKVAVSRCAEAPGPCAWCPGAKEWTMDFSQDHRVLIPGWGIPSIFQADVLGGSGLPWAVAGCAGLWDAEEKRARARSLEMWSEREFGGCVWFGRSNRVSGSWSPSACEVFWALGTLNERQRQSPMSQAAFCGGEEGAESGTEGTSGNNAGQGPRWARLLFHLEVGGHLDQGAVCTILGGVQGAPRASRALPAWATAGQRPEVDMCRVSQSRGWGSCVVGCLPSGHFGFFLGSGEPVQENTAGGTGHQQGSVGLGWRHPGVSWENWEAGAGPEPGVGGGAAGLGSSPTVERCARPAGSTGAGHPGAGPGCPPVGPGDIVQGSQPMRSMDCSEQSL